MRSASLMMTTFQPLPLQSAAGACAAAGLRRRGDREMRLKAIAQVV